MLGLVVAGIVVYSGPVGFTREDRARLDTRSLQSAVRAYYARQKVYPNTLNELTRLQPDGSPPLVEKGGLVDPWGNPYDYDPNARHQKSDMPLIYSNGPPGRQKQISNWD
jgi:type II secretory pathway pseudopilin PulG